ncbi:MAG: hypothetical protein H6718_20250 [Polyangiaceae bacterium]|nr:hypothetical protein [Myxococcales bacterium]MCB9587746.1 hypothetical protein [Polyangiaceae bacterium]
MAGVWHTFQMAGWTAWFCVLLLILAIPISLVGVTLVIARQRAGRMFAIFVLCFGMLAPGLGAFGMYRGRALVDEVLESDAVEPSAKARIREQGYYEAEQAVWVGLVCGALPLLAGTISLGLSFVIPPGNRPEPQ